MKKVRIAKAAGKKCVYRCCIEAGFAIASIGDFDANKSGRFEPARRKVKFVALEANRGKDIERCRRGVGSQLRKVARIGTFLDCSVAYPYEIQAEDDPEQVHTQAVNCR